MDDPRKTRRTGRLILFLLLLCLVLVFLGLAFSRARLPWRVLRPLADDDARWTLTAGSLRVEPVQWSMDGISLSAPSARAVIDWPRLVAGGNLRRLSVPESRLEITDAPESLAAFDFSVWRAVLAPERFPVEQFAMPDLTIVAGSSERTLVGSFSGIRNPAGAMEASGSVEDAGMSLEIFLRLGWDSLESGGTFSGTIRPGVRPRESVFPSEPFQSLLGPFSDVRVEGSFFLDESWRYRNGVRMVDAAEESARMGGDRVRELAFSAATVFAESGAREDRAILEGLSPDAGNLFRIEVARRGHGPVHASFSLNGAVLLRIDADQWRTDSPARAQPTDAGASVTGHLREGSGGELIFDPDPGSTIPLPDIRIPGIFAAGP